MMQKHAVSAAQTCMVMQWNLSQFSKNLTEEMLQPGIERRTGTASYSQNRTRTTFGQPHSSYPLCLSYLLLQGRVQQLLS
jgi:hypothetical protein